MGDAMRGRPPGRGLVLNNPGGTFGWLMRRICPRVATRIYLGWIRRTREKPTRRFIAAFGGAASTPMFNHVEIETLNRCNGECDFCPVNRRQDSREFRRMPEKLFAKILSELAAIDYSGYLGIFSNNEPLLDTRLEGFAAAARATLPDAYLNLSTNGSLLDVDALRRLLPSFDRIVVNNYNDRPAMLENIRRVYDFCLGYEGQRMLEGRTLEISLRSSRDVLTTRGGSAPNREPASLSMPCALPFSQLVIRPDGKVSLCCNDALGQVTLGDVSRQGVVEVWLGDAFRGVRETMAREGRSALPLCRECDFVKHDVEA